jgi:hypothetical protein
MSIVTVFNLPSMDAEKYKRVINELDSAGLGHPKGRLFHVASINQNGGFTVTDVWESPELLDEFGKTLMPALEKAGVQQVEPLVQSVHNVISGMVTSAAL